MADRQGYQSISEAERREKWNRHIVDVVNDIAPEEMKEYEAEKRELECMVEHVHRDRVMSNFRESGMGIHANGEGIFFRVRDMSIPGDKIRSHRMGLTWKQARLFFTSGVIDLARPSTLQCIRMIPIATHNEMALGLQQVLLLCSTNLPVPPKLEAKFVEHVYVGLACLRVLRIHLPALTVKRFSRLTNSLPPDDSFFRIEGFKQMKAYTDFFPDEFFMLRDLSFAAKGHIARELTSTKTWDSLCRQHEMNDKARKLRKLEQKGKNQSAMAINMNHFMMEFSMNFDDARPQALLKRSTVPKHPIVPRTPSVEFIPGVLANTMREKAVIPLAKFILPSRLKSMVSAQGAYIKRVYDDAFVPRSDAITPSELSLFKEDSGYTKEQFKIISEPCHCFSVKALGASVGALPELRTCLCERHALARDKNRIELSFVYKREMPTETEETVKEYKEAYYKRLREKKFGGPVTPSAILDKWCI